MGCALFHSGRAKREGGTERLTQQALDAKAAGRQDRGAVEDEASDQGMAGAAGFRKRKECHLGGERGAQEATLGIKMHVERLDPGEGEIQSFKQLDTGSGFEEDGKRAARKVFAMHGTDGHARVAQQHRAVLPTLGDQEVVEDGREGLGGDLVAPGQGIDLAQAMPVAAQSRNGRALWAVA